MLHETTLSGKKSLLSSTTTLDGARKRAMNYVTTPTSRAQLWSCVASRQKHDTQS